MKGSRKRWIYLALAGLLCWTGSTQALAGSIPPESTKQETMGSVNAVSESSFFEEVDVSSMVYQAGGLGTPAREDNDIEAYAISASEQLKNDILQALLAGEESLDISAYGITGEEAWTLYAEVLNENGRLFYVKSALSYGSSNGKVTTLGFNYDLVTDEEKKAFNDKLAGVASLAGNVSSEMEKALILHDYLAQNCTYAYREYLDGTLSSCPNVYDAYGVLIRGKAVCQGYAEAYQALLKEAGILSYVCSSKTMNHAWNVILIDGSWYHVDVTWDDPTWNREGRACHEYFLLSDLEMEARRHNGWVDNVECDSAKYDDYWWKEVDSKIVRIASQDYVYVKNVDGKFQLVRRTGEAESVIYNSNLRWNVWEKPNSYWTTSFAFLSEQGNNIYFNDRSNVYSLSLDNLVDADPEVEYTYDKNDGYIYGAMVYQDGKILLNICQSPNEETDNFLDAGEVSQSCSHNMVRTPAKTPTCKETGNIEYWTCSICGWKFTDEAGKKKVTDADIVIAVTNEHGETEVRNRVEATNEQEGYTGDIYCKVCGRKIADGTVIPILPVPTAAPTAAPDYCISGTVKLSGDTAATVELIDTQGAVAAKQTVSGSTAEYSLKNVPAGTYTLRVSQTNGVVRECAVVVTDTDVSQDMEVQLLGDVNGDGTINARDKKLLFNHIEKISELAGYLFEVGDVNGDGTINARDKKMLYNHIERIALLWEQ